MIAVPEQEASSSRMGDDPRRQEPLSNPESILHSIPDSMMNNWLVTGGAGFIGSNFILSSRAEKKARIFNLDKLGASGNLANLESLRNDQDHIFIKSDIRNRILVQRVLHEYMPNAVIHFAAECSADHTFYSPEIFIQTNVLGTFSLLEEVRQYWESMEEGKRDRFRFLHISSAEVYGNIAPDGEPHTEQASYDPIGIYASSKAACDHLVRSYHRIYGLPVMVANTASVYGPHQFPYEPVPRIVMNAVEGREIPLLGNGKTRRSWLHVDDFSRALRLILERGRPAETYHVSEQKGYTDRETVYLLCDILDDYAPKPRGSSHRSFIDQIGGEIAVCPGCLLDGSKIGRELGWRPQETLESGLRKTVRWYLNNAWWTDAVRTGEYRSWKGRRAEWKTGTE